MILDKALRTGGNGVEETLRVSGDAKNEGAAPPTPFDFHFDGDDVGRAAVLLAITKNAEMEAACRQHIEEQGWRVVATEVGGLLSDLPQKIVRALVGASLNAGIIEKNNRECMP